MTPREFDGWVPAERHLHYDAEDNLTGYTVVERESRIDDRDRQSLLGLAWYKAEVCECGFHPSLTVPENLFEPGQRVCPVCKGAVVWRRVQAAEDERATKALGEHPSPYAPRPADGRHTYMRMLPPAEAAQRKQAIRRDDESRPQ